MLLVSIMTLIDTWVGRWYAKRNGEIITSRKTRLGLTRKLIIYFLVVFVSYLIDYTIINEITKNYIWFDWAFTKFFTLVLLWIEYTSIDEKVKWVYGRGLTDRVVDFAKSLKKIVGFTKEIDPTK
jgi:phage-related holin